MLCVCLTLSTIMVFAKLLGIQRFGDRYSWEGFSILRFMCTCSSDVNAITINYSL